MKKIMLDPGHAGYYYNRSPVNPNYYESATMWEFAKYLKIALEAYGFIVGMTRYSVHDDPELTERGRRAKGFDLFLSLHSNAAGTKYPDAPWIIHYASDDMTWVDEESKKIASVIGPVVSELMGVSDPYYYTKTCDFDRDGDGRIGDEYYGVLFGAKSVGVPGIIIEHSFHTNEAAAEWLLSDSNLMKLAEAEAEALAKYYGMEAPMTAAEKKEFEAHKKEVEALKKEITTLKKDIDDLEHVKIKYNSTSSCPSWARPTIEKLYEKKLIEGDENGNLTLNKDLLRVLVILDRKKLFD